jgi:uncharacterized protein YneF (UPF0154 family)
MLITIIISLTLGFAGGFYAGVKNANSSKVNKAKDIVDLIKK